MATPIDDLLIIVEASHGGLFAKQIGTPHIFHRLLEFRVYDSGGSLRMVMLSGTSSSAWNRAKPAPPENGRSHVRPGDGFSDLGDAPLMALCVGMWHDQSPAASARSGQCAPKM